MPQHDLDIANGSGAAVRGDINGALAALGSTMKGPNAPPAPTAGMMWVEDDNPSSTRWTLRVYDGADWITIGIIDSTTNRFEPTTGAITASAGDITAQAGSLRSQISGAATTGQVVLGNGAARLFYNGSRFDLNGPLDVNGVAVAPLPQVGAGVGQWQSIQSGTGNAMNLPAGGTWAWSLLRITGGGAITLHGSSVSAGGTQIGAATAGEQYIGIAWRIA